MKKRLLFFTNSLYGGGAEKVLQTLLSNLDLNKYDITLYSVNEGVLNDSYPKGINYKYIFKQNASTFLSRMWTKISNKFKLTIYYKFNKQIFMFQYNHIYYSPINIISQNKKNKIFF